MNVDDDGDIDERLERFLLLDQNDFGFLFIDQSTNLKTIPSNRIFERR